MAPSERFHHGEWTFDLFVLPAEDTSSFSGTVDISQGRKHRCKLVLAKPATAREVGIAELRAQCLAWVAGRMTAPD
ncbi:MULTISPECIES: hypothetical protein [Variovorax]|uniref:hypothetical protein n=1 Tax=Variovorax TaxID=34072 RepID=UPI00285D7649|nr:hypothetical protein [Variovorax sp. 3319]MDR6890894.1 hypothetical protein [Variovorax sp. 3319]